MVYFIQAVDGGPIKIGTTIQLMVRLQTLANECQADLQVLAVMDGGRDVERELHERFADLRAVGEWFEPGDDLLGFIVKEGKEWDVEAECKLKTIVGLKGTDELVTWVDDLVEHTRLGTRSFLVRSALRSYAESVGYLNPMPKR